MPMSIEPMRIGRLAVTLTLLFLGGAVAAADAGRNLEAETEAWHARRIERLKAEDGWLTLVGLVWLSEGDNVVGSAESAPVRLPASAPARVGVFTRKGDDVRFTPEKGVKVELGNKPFKGGPVNSDAKGPADVLRLGPIQMLVVKRGERIGVRLRDAQSEVRKNFRGITRFPVSEAWRKQARFEPATSGRTLAVPNVLGEIENMPAAGTAIFTHEGKEHRLEAVEEGNGLFFIFGDSTNRDESYGAGRFLSTELPKDGRVTLDFNRATNPPCAFTSYATCPLPPKGNRLPIRVEAGEKRYGDH